MVEPLKYDFSCSLIKQSVFFQSHIIKPRCLLSLLLVTLFQSLKTWLSLPQLLTFCCYPKNLELLDMTYSTWIFPKGWDLPISNDLLLSFTPFILSVFHFLLWSSIQCAPPPILLIQSSHLSVHSIISTPWFWDLIDMSTLLISLFFLSASSYFSYPDYIPLAFILISLLQYTFNFLALHSITVTELSPTAPNCVPHPKS